jgi:6-hydroxycyclohex-1-ene-1-carbonyl-CoA dehydrogenase
MSAVPKAINTWQMAEGPVIDPETKKVTAPGTLVRTEIPVPDLAENEALVKVAGCGVCHTDLGYFYDGVPTVNKPPLTLGHEISGIVVAGPNPLVGRDVLVPAVMPCNNCPICAAGRENRCLAQKMPGNSLGMYGGFADYIPVPAGDLCLIDDTGDLPLSHYAVIADAGTTPYQAVKRAEVSDGDRVIVFGAAGGVGSYVTQMAKAFGADVVIGIDINQPRLERARQYGADFIVNVSDMDFQSLRDEFRNICKQAGVPSNYGWKIFEVTGVGTAQDMALGLLSFIGKLIIVGFGQARNQYAVSRLMAFDAEIIGTWGCPPRYYPDVLKLVQSGRVQIEPFVETKPMSLIKEVFEQQHAGVYDKRQVLEPDF